MPAVGPAEGLLETVITSGCPELALPENSGV